MKRLFVFCLAVFVCLAPVHAAEKPQSEPKEVVLLLTHPSASELKNIDVLVKKEILKMPKLKVIGLVHKSEYEHYRGAQRYIDSRKMENMSLLHIDCRIEPDEIFKANGCTEIFTELVARSDGIFFTGGPDIPPSIYGEKTRLTTAIQDPPRHHFELSLIFHLLKFQPEKGKKPLLAARPDYLVLGLCLGMQSLNVATGGGLYQDIPSQIYGVDSLEAYAELPADARHRSAIAQLDPAPLVGWAQMHRVRFSSKAVLTKRLAPGGKPVTVLSLHHQALRKLGSGWRVLASSMDGKVVEAIEHTGFQHVLGVQFHPEKRTLYDPNLVYQQRKDDPEQNFVFAAMRADRQSRSFLQRFWVFISESLAASRKSR